MRRQKQEQGRKITRKKSMLRDIAKKHFCVISRLVLQMLQINR